MLFLISVLNLLHGIFTFYYLFFEPTPSRIYLYAVLLYSIVLNILFFVLIRKKWKKYSDISKIFFILFMLFGDFELWIPIFTTSYLIDILW